MIKKFPGLKSLWLSFHPVCENKNSAMDLMVRLSRSVLDPDYVDESQWVEKGKNLILLNNSLICDANMSMEVGLRLANDLGQMRMPLNSGMYEQPVIYRDDNRHLWKDTSNVSEPASEINQVNESNTHDKQLKENTAGRELMFSEESTNYNSGYVVNEKHEAALEYLKLSGKGGDNNFLYPEWDYRSHVLKKDWCYLFEAQSQAGSNEKVEAIFEKHKVTLNRLRMVAKKLQIEKRQRTRKLEDGDDIDLDLAIGATVSMRTGVIPDSRVFVRDDYRHVKAFLFQS